MSTIHRVIGLLVVLWPGVALGQTSKAGVVTSLQGTATVARAAVGQAVALSVQDDVYVRDRIVSGEQSIVRILLGARRSSPSVSARS